MTENKHYTPIPQEEEEMEIDLMEYARKLWDARKLLLKVGGIAIIIGIIIAFSIPKEYTVNVVLSPEATKTGRSSTLSSMASMLGFGNVNGNDANALNLTMAGEIVASTPFILDLFDTQVQTIDAKMDTTLVAYFETESKPWWNKVMALPGMAIGGIRSLFIDNDEMEEKPLDPFRLTRKEMIQVGRIRRAITAEVDKKTMITQVSVTTQDPLVTAALADTVINQLQQYITQYKVSKANEDCKYWEQLFEERQEDYYEAQEKYAKYADTNQGVVLQSVKIEQERLQNEVNIAFQMFTQVATQLQMARAKVQEEKPVFAVLEPATVPLLPSGTSRKMILLGIVFLAIVGTSAWILFGQSLWESLKKGLSEQKEKREA